MRWVRDVLNDTMKWEATEAPALDQCKHMTAEEFYSEPATQRVLRQIKSERDAETRRQELANLGVGQSHLSAARKPA